MDGMTVECVAPGGAADVAGLRPGMTLVTIAGEAVTTAEDVVHLFAESPGTFKVSVYLPEQASPDDNCVWTPPGAVSAASPSGLCVPPALAAAVMLSPVGIMSKKSSVWIKKRGVSNLAARSLWLIFIANMRSYSAGPCPTAARAAAAAAAAVAVTAAPLTGPAAAPSPRRCSSTSGSASYDDRSSTPSERQWTSVL